MQRVRRGRIALLDSGPAWWLGTWTGEALLALLIAVVSMSRKAQATRMPLFSRPARRVALSFSPAMCAAAVLTVALYHAGLYSLLPGMWLLAYGTEW